MGSPDDVAGGSGLHFLVVRAAEVGTNQIIRRPLEPHSEEWMPYRTSSPPRPETMIVVPLPEESTAPGDQGDEYVPTEPESELD